MFVSRCTAVAVPTAAVEVVAPLHPSQVGLLKEIDAAGSFVGYCKLSKPSQASTLQCPNHYAITLQYIEVNLAGQSTGSSSHSHNQLAKRVHIGALHGFSGCFEPSRLYRFIRLLLLANGHKQPCLAWLKIGFSASACFFHLNYIIVFFSMGVLCLVHFRLEMENRSQAEAPTWVMPSSTS